MDIRESRLHPLEKNAQNVLFERFKLQDVGVNSVFYRFLRNNNSISPTMTR